MEKEQVADAIMETFREKLDTLSQVNKGFDKTIQFYGTDIATGYLIRFEADGTAGLEKYKGGARPADVTVYLTIEVMDKVMKKEVNPVTAMMQGLLRIEGDISALTRLLPVIT